MAQLLTGASLVTLSIAGGPARHCRRGRDDHQDRTRSYTVPADHDWINIDASDISTFTNDSALTFNAGGSTRF
jgi:hypothetical protein